MNDASFTTQRRKGRVLFADRVIQQATLDVGIKNTLMLEGVRNLTAMTYTPNYYDIVTGALYTTTAEQQSYIDGVSGAHTAENDPPSNTTVPDAPTDISAVGGFAEATVSFTPPANNGGAPITLYTVISSPGGFVGTGTSSPITVPYLSNNTAYTFTVVATNSVGDSASSPASNSATTITPSSSAPTITGINALLDSFIVTFTAPASFGTIANYEYSLDGGATFTALSPPDAASPIAISSLTSSTTYSVAIRAVNNVPATGDPSNIVTISTATTQITETFSTPISTTWTAPANVRYVQYLCVGAGGGGGGCYSDILVLGAVPVQSSAPAGGGYWIYNGTTTATYTYARMYNGANTNTSGGASTFTKPIRVTASADTTVPPGGNDSTRWHGGKEVIYYLTTVSPPNVSNYGIAGYIVGAYNNLPSAGSGGGAGGQIKATFTATSYYNVTPKTAYTVIVGDGGDGGTATASSETAGTKGGDSTFDTITSEGGSGGQPSRILTNNTDGYNNGGRGGQNGSSTIREGQGGQGSGGAGQQNNITVGGYAGASSGVGPNFAGYSWGGGGTGGAPGAVTTGDTIANVGKGGAGTGATLNSYASGIKGGTGVVILKYYI